MIWNHLMGIYSNTRFKKCSFYEFFLIYSLWIKKKVLLRSQLSLLYCFCNLGEWLWFMKSVHKWERLSVSLPSPPYHPRMEASHIPWCWGIYRHRRHLKWLVTLQTGQINWIISKMNRRTENWFIRLYTKTQIGG